MYLVKVATQSHKKSLGKDEIVDVDGYSKKKMNILKNTLNFLIKC